MRSTRAKTITLLTALTLLLTPVAAGARALLLSGSTSMFPLVIQLAALYHKDTHQPTPSVGQGTSGAGIDEVAAGRVDIGDVSRDPIIGQDPKGLVFTKIARDALCVITNKSNPISNLSAAAGRTDLHRTNSQLERSPGATATGPIDLYDRVASSGTQDAFEDIFLGETLKVAPSASQQETEGGMRQAVIGDKNGVGFASFDFISGNQRGRLPGHSMHAAQREVRPVRGRAQLLDGDQGRSEGRGREVHRLGHQPPQHGGREDHRDGLDTGLLRQAPRRRLGSSDRRAELLLGALAVGVLALIALLLVTVLVKAWPSFSHNGYVKWFFPGGDVDTQLTAIENARQGSGEAALPPARLAAALGDDPHDRPGGDLRAGALDAFRDLHRRVRTTRAATGARSRRAPARGRCPR